MSIFRRIRERLRGKASRLRRLKHATYYLMRHVRMTGQCECLLTRDADGRRSYLLVIRTLQFIPVVDRESFQLYFRRKLADLGELGALPLVVVIRDGNDLLWALRQTAHVSSGRIASIIAAANQELPLSEEAVNEMRKKFAESREHRFRASDYVPIRHAPMTDLGQL